MCRYSKKNKSTPLFSEFNASEISRKTYFGIKTVASEASRNILEKFAFSPNSTEVKVRLFIFFPEENRLFFQHFVKVRIFISE